MFQYFTIQGNFHSCEPGAPGPLQDTIFLLERLRCFSFSGDGSRLVYLWYNSKRNATRSASVWPVRDPPLPKPYAATALSSAPPFVLIKNSCSVSDQHSVIRK